MSAKQGLQEALVLWFASAHRHLKSTQPPLRQLRQVGLNPDGEVSAQIGGGVEPHIWPWIHAQRRMLTELPETANVAKAVRSLSLPPYADDLKLTISSSKLQDNGYIFYYILFPLLNEHLVAYGIEEPDANEVNKMADQIIDYLHHPVIRLTPSFVILSGIRTSKDLELETGVTLRATTPQEWKRYYFDDEPFDPNVMTHSGFIGLGYAPLHILEISEPLMGQAQAIAETFVLACRLLGIPTAGYQYIEQRTTNPIRRMASARLPPLIGSGYIHSSVQLTPEHAQALHERWKIYRRIHDDTSTRILVDRYGQAFSRPTFEDQIVDLWVALESMFALDGGEGELSYRISLRISRLLQKDPGERQEMFMRLKGAYRARSQVVHGVAGKKAKEKQKVIEHIDYMRDVVTRILKMMADEGWQPDYPRMDFEDF